MNCVSIAQRRWLWDKSHAARMLADRLRISSLVARPSDHADLFDSGGEGLFDNDAEDGLLFSVAVNQSLQRKSALRLRRGGDYRLCDFHWNPPCK